MMKINGKLIKKGNNEYIINHKRKFKSVGVISSEDVEECFDFSYEMAFGEGCHREHRSGGDKKRGAGEIFVDTFQGKLAEFAMYRYLLKHGIETSKPDMGIYERGIWDSFDLEYQEKHMAVKSTKFYGNLLLLETKDWNQDGEYIPNNSKGTYKYDFFILLRISPDAETEMRESGLLDALQIPKSMLSDLIKNQKWEYDIAGVITDKDFKNLIAAKYILPKNALLNGTVHMDAENYYVQAADMRTGDDLLKRLIEYKNELRNEHNC